MSERRKTIQELIEDFVFLDCRLGEHPDVAAVVSYKYGDELAPVAATGSSRLEVMNRVFPGESSWAGQVIERKKIISVAEVPDQTFSPLYDAIGRPARFLLGGAHGTEEAG
jgi:hypothetical protein